MCRHAFNNFGNNVSLISPLCGRSKVKNESCMQQCWLYTRLCCDAIDKTQQAEYAIRYSIKPTKSVYIQAKECIYNRCFKELSFK